MTSNPFFSIILPVYNAEAFILRALDSVTTQTYSDYEIVITNDGATDCTEQYVRNWSAEHPAILFHLVCQNNLGLGKARNSAISRATGEFLAYLDADDVWYPERLARIRQYLDDHPEVDVLCNDERIVEEGKPSRIHRYGPYRTFEDLLLLGSTLSPSATVTRRTKTIEAGLFSEDRSFHGVEDLDLWIRLSLTSRIDYLHEVLGACWLHPDNMSGDSAVFVRNISNVVQHHLATVKGEIPRWKIRKRLALTYYGGARTAQKRNRASESLQWYLKSLWEYPLLWKTYAGLALLLMRQKA